MPPRCRFASPSATHRRPRYGATRQRRQTSGAGTSLRKSRYAHRSAVREVAYVTESPVRVAPYGQPSRSGCVREQRATVLLLRLCGATALWGGSKLLLGKLGAYLAPSTVARNENAPAIARSRTRH